MHKAKSNFKARFFPAKRAIMNEENQTQDKLQASVHKSVEHVRTKLVPDYGTKIGVILAIIACVIVAFIYVKSEDAKKIKDDREVLGKALYFLNKQKTDSAEIILKDIIAQAGLDASIKAKAALLQGNILFEKGEYPAAIEKYTFSVSQSAEKVLIKSAAEHGLAATYIQQKEYAKAVESLNAYITAYGRKTAAIQKAGEETPETDLVVDIPDALWKLALSQKELKNSDAAKAACQKIIDLYNENMNYSAKAKSLLATM